MARAIEKIRADTAGVYNNRQDLESVLNRLIEEFRPELISLGVKVGDGRTTPAPRFFSFTPIDRAQVRGGYVNRDFSLINNQGLKFQGGVNGGHECAGRMGERHGRSDVRQLHLRPERQQHHHSRP